MSDTETPSVADMLAAAVDTLQARTGRTITGALVFTDDGTPHVVGTINAEDLTWMGDSADALDADWDRLRVQRPDGPVLNDRREFTHPSVYEGIAAGADWADPREIHEIDWDERLAAALVPFTLDGDGLPVNPVEYTDVWEGRNEFGHWGEKVMVDAVVFATYRGHRRLLMVKRRDGHGWALPGGGVEEGESRLEAVVRELGEETGLFHGVDANWEWRPPRYVPDPRASRRAWAVTVPFVTDLGTVAALPAVTGGDDARLAEWVAAGSFDMLELDLSLRFGGEIFPAHRELLRDLL